MWIMDAVDCSYLVTYISLVLVVRRRLPVPLLTRVRVSSPSVSRCCCCSCFVLSLFFPLSLFRLQFTVRWIPCHLIVLVCRRICCCFLIILVVTALYFYLSSMLSIYPLHLSFSCVRESVDEVERKGRPRCRDTARARGCHGRFRRSRSCGYCG